MGKNKKILVEVAYASVTTAKIIAIEVEPASTCFEAISQSGILSLFPEIDLSSQKIGVFSESRALSSEVKAGDRVEIYRPLIINPKDARREKARLSKKSS